MFSWLGLAYIVACWVLSLATVWVGWVGYLRFQALQGQLASARHRVKVAESMLGSTLNEESEPMSDAQEAVLEQEARHRRFMERQWRDREGAEKP